MFGFRCGLAPVSVNGRWGYIDKEGETVIAFQYDQANPFSANGLAAAQIDGKWGYIDRGGDFVIPPQYDWAGLFDEDTAIVEMDGKEGMINAAGDMIVSCQYDSIFSTISQSKWVKCSLNDDIKYINRKTGAIWKYEP